MKCAFLVGLVVTTLVLVVPYGGAEPETADSTDRIIFYLHGKIVEDQGLAATSERFGRYEYEAILKALRGGGHEVVSEVREGPTNSWEYAKKIVSEITKLKEGGVPSQHITVVGASKGAAIAVLVSHLLEDPKINYVFLAICGQRMLEYWESNDICTTGRILSVYEASDELAQSCDALAARCSSGITRYQEIELGLGLGHGMVYRPYDEWVLPSLGWSIRKKPSD
jgi:hypothetical protein